MKQILAFGILLVAITALSLRTAHDAKSYAPYTCTGAHHDPLENQFTLSFDWAPKEKALELSEYKFSVKFNDVQIFRNPALKDRSIHHESLKISGKVGVNKLRFIGQTDSVVGIEVTNIKLERTTFCGYEDIIINGKFSEGLPDGKDYYQTTSIKGWTGIPNLEIAKGPYFNSAWPTATIVVELSAQSRSSIEQTFELDKFYRLL